MPQFDAQGNIHSKIILDSQQFFAEMNKVQSSLNQMATGIQNSGKRVGMGLAAAHESWLHHATKVVLTFTLFYRAMNLVENGMKRLAQQTYDTIKVIDDLNKQAIVTTATMVSFSKVLDPTEAFKTALPAVRDLMIEMEIVAARHIVTARQLQEAYSAFAKKGIFGGKEDLENIATIADTIAVIARQTGMTYQQMQEIYGIMEGQVGRGRELAYLLKGLHPNLKSYIEDLKKAGVDINNQHILLKEIAESDLIGMKAALGEIWDLWETQTNTLKSYWNIIKRIGGAEIYKEAVSMLQRINTALVDGGKYTKEMHKWAGLWRDVMQFGWQLAKLIEPIIGVISRNTKEIGVLLDVLASAFSILRGLIASVMATIEAAMLFAQISISRLLGLGDAEEAIVRLQAVTEAFGATWDDVFKDIYNIFADTSEGMQDASEDAEDAFNKMRAAMYGTSNELFRGINEGIDKFISNAEDAFEQGKKMAKDFSKDLTNLLNDYFMNAANQARTFENFMISIFMALANAVSNYISQLIVAKALGGLQFIIPSGKAVQTSVGTRSVTSEFGVTPGRLQFNQPAPTLPKFHSGGLVPRMRLGSDEVPAILRSGETVLPQGVSPTTYNITIRAVDAKSFVQLARSHPEAIISPLRDFKDLGGRL